MVQKALPLLDKATAGASDILAGSTTSVLGTANFSNYSATNAAVRILPLGRYKLTPIYVVMTIWPVKGNGANQFSWYKAKFAMALQGKNRHYSFKDIRRRHFNTIEATFFQRERAEDVIKEVLEDVEPTIASVTARLPNGYPEKIAISVFAGLRRTAQILADSPP